MVFEMLDMDLSSYLARNIITTPEVWALTGQMLAGLEYMHRSGIIHRDLKPQNLLLKANVDGGGFPVLKIADFGLARSTCEPVKAYSSEMITLWYRPPELLLDAISYGSEVDIWSAGCIVAEMALGQPLLAGHDVDDQLARIVQCLGLPLREDWPEIWDMPSSSKLDTVRLRRPSRPLDSVLGHCMSRLGITLVSRCLSYSPAGRCTAASALEMELFQD